MRHSAAPTWAMGNSVSTTSGSSSSTPSPSPCARAPHGVDPQQDIAGIGQQRLALGRHDGTPALAVEQRHAQFGFHVGDGMADGRLHPRQLAGGARKLPASATAANTRNWSRVRASSIGVSDLWNRSVALKDYHLTGSPRTGMLAASIRGHRRRRWTSETRTARARETEQGMGRTGDAQGGTPAGSAGRRCWPSGAGVAALQGHHRRAAVAAGHGLDLAAVGSLTAVFSVLGMVGGIAAGGVIARFGARAACCCWGHRVGTAAGAAAPGWRRVAGIARARRAGFPMITVAGPAALQRLETRWRRDLAFALWSCYMPGAWPSPCWPRRPRGLACVLVGAAALLRWPACAACATVRRRRKPVLARPAAGHDRHVTGPRLAPTRCTA